MKIFLIVLLAVAPEAFSQDPHYFFVFLNKKADRKELPKEEVDKIMEGHMANIRRLAKEGKLIVAGPFEGGGGIFIFKSSSLQETRDWLGTDPGVQAERWNVEVLPYTPRMGSVCPAPEPIQMVNYEFIRLIPPAVPGTTSKSSDEDHLSHLKKSTNTGDIVTEGSFGAAGAIVVLRGELQKTLIESDPLVLKEGYRPEYKKLYVAKGAFCEN